MAAVQIAKGTCFVTPSCRRDCLLMRSLIRLFQRLVVKSSLRLQRKKSGGSAKKRAEPTIPSTIPRLGGR